MDADLVLRAYDEQVRRSTAPPQSPSTLPRSADPDAAHRRETPYSLSFRARFIPTTAHGKGR